MEGEGSRRGGWPVLLAAVSLCAGVPWCCCGGRRRPVPTHLPRFLARRTWGVWRGAGLRPPSSPPPSSPSSSTLTTACRRSWRSRWVLPEELGGTGEVQGRYRRGTGQSRAGSGTGVRSPSRRSASDRLVPPPLPLLPTTPAGGVQPEEAVCLPLRPPPAGWVEQARAAPLPTPTPVPWHQPSPKLQATLP
jgi:hypothetical protein